jgi:hypothetical protein
LALKWLKSALFRAKNDFSIPENAPLGNDNRGRDSLIIGSS